MLYLHGTPDSRLARHPDDDVAARAGVRLLAIDRPGIGGSDPDPGATPRSVADDLVAVLDHLGIDAVAAFAWSAGSLFALALAGVHPHRCRRVVLAAPLVPADAYGDRSVLDGADDARRLFADVHRDMHPDEVGAELAGWLVPPSIDDDTARSMLEGSITRLRDIDGAGDQLVVGLRASVANGFGGLEREIAAQATPLGPLLDAMTPPVHLHAGTDDTVAPPAMAAWLATRLGATLTVHDGLGHDLAIRLWSSMLTEAAAAPQRD